MKNIIITGASGLVATELACRLLEKTDTHLYLLSTHPERITARYDAYGGRVSCHTLDSFSAYAGAAGLRYDCCIHTAFARSTQGNMIADSIEYQRNLINVLKELEPGGAFVNISSQSVYGKISEPLWKESYPLAPDSLYAMGKYCSEVVTQEMLAGSGIRWTNIRLCSVCENARFIRVFVRNVTDGRPIVLTAPDQQCSFIDVQDVADALVCLVEKLGSVELGPVYNLGANLIDTIKGVALRVNRIAGDRYGLKPVDIIEESSADEIHIGMDSSLFMDTFGWTPHYDMDDMTVEMFEMLRGGRMPVSFKLVYNLWT